MNLPFNEIQHDDLEAIKLAIAQGAILIDVRSDEEFLAGSAAGAQHIPLDQIPARLDELHPDESYVVFCRSGQRSDYAQRFLEQNGFQHVLNGGSFGMMIDLVGDH